eukprot:6492587-Amphidinium_carterae.1
MQIWSAHWLKHFAAAPSQSHGFHNFNIEGVSTEFVNPQIATAAGDDPLCFSSVEVAAAIREFNPRSAAPDTCPHRYWPELEPWLSAAISQSIKICVDHGTTPDSWSGSLVVPILKKGKSPFHPGSHRPIQLMKVEAKIFSKLLLKELAQHMVISAQQFAHGSGVGIPLILSQQHLARAADLNQSTAMVFLDIAAAYDSVSHQLLIGVPDDLNAGDHSAEHSADLILQGLIGAGCDLDEARKLQAHLLEYPHHLFTQRVPPRLLRLLRHWIASPWMQLPGVLVHGQSELQPSMEFTQGVRQGDCLSTFLFCIFFDTVLSRLKLFIDEETTPLKFPSAGDRPGALMTTSPPPAHGPQSRVSLLAYADDVLLPMANASPSQLVKDVRLVMQFASELFAKFHLKLNLGRQKTELCLHLTSREAKPILQHLRQDATQLAAEKANAVLTGVLPCITFTRGHIEIVDKYPYLGRWSTSRPDARQDFNVKKALAASSFALYKKVLCSPRFTVFTRLHLFKVLVRCHYTQNTLSYHDIPSRLMASASRAYVVMLKRITTLKITEEFLHVSDSDFLAHIGEPSLEQIMDLRAVSSLPKLCASCNPLVGVALSCVSKSSLWTSWLSSLSRLRDACPDLHGMPAPTPTTFQQWLTMMIPAQPEWKALARRALSPREPAVNPKNIYKVVLWDELERPLLLAGDFGEAPLDADPYFPAGEGLEKPFVCPICEKAFATNRGLSTHKMRQHWLIPPLSLRVRGTQCVACSSQLGTRTRLLGHLQDKLACALFVIAHEEPMELSEYFTSVGELNRQNECYLKRARYPWKLAGTPVSRLLRSTPMMTPAANPMWLSAPILCLAVSGPPC